MVEGGSKEGRKQGSKEGRKIYKEREGERAQGKSLLYQDFKKAEEIKEA